MRETPHNPPLYSSIQSTPPTSTALLIVSDLLKIDDSVVSTEVIRAEKSFGEVYRLRATQPLPSLGDRRTAILKITKAINGTDLDMGTREARFYSEILPQLDVVSPQMYFTYQRPELSEQYLLLEDLQEKYQNFLINTERKIEGSWSLF